MDEFTLQPLPAHEDELTGLLIMKAALLEQGETARDTILIPDSAHGTNPASAALVGFKVQTVPTSPAGIIEPETSNRISVPSSRPDVNQSEYLGAFEERRSAITAMIHDYRRASILRWCNLNAILGGAPGDMGFDLIHLNLHKTFCHPMAAVAPAPDRSG